MIFVLVLVYGDLDYGNDLALYKEHVLPDKEFDFILKRVGLVNKAEKHIILLWPGMNQYSYRVKSLVKAGYDNPSSFVWIKTEQQGIGVNKYI